MKRLFLFLLPAALLLLSACTQTRRTASPESVSARQHPTDGRAGNKKEVVKELSAADFRRLVMDYELHPREWVYAGKRPVLIDFYATWCGPCKAMSPVVEELAAKYTGQVDVYKVDIDKEEELAAVFGISSIPSLLFIPMEGGPQWSVGALGREQLDEAVQKVLLGGKTETP